MQVRHYVIDPSRYYCQPDPDGGKTSDATTSLTLVELHQLLEVVLETTCFPWPESLYSSHQAEEAQTLLGLVLESLHQAVNLLEELEAEERSHHHQAEEVGTDQAEGVENRSW